MRCLRERRERRRLRRASLCAERRCRARTGNCEGMGKGFGVHDGEAQKQEAEHGHADGFNSEAEGEVAEQKERGHGQLDQRIP